MTDKSITERLKKAFKEIKSMFQSRNFEGYGEPLCYIHGPREQAITGITVAEAVEQLKDMHIIIIDPTTGESWYKGKKVEK